MNPYDNNGARTPAADPFEQSLTSQQQRLDALKAVKTAQEVLRLVIERETKCVARARDDIARAEAKAIELGAYDLIPANLRPKAQAVAS